MEFKIGDGVRFGPGFSIWPFDGEVIDCADNYVFVVWEVEEFDGWVESRKLFYALNGLERVLRDL